MSQSPSTKLATAARILAHFGHGSGLAGQLSTRGLSNEIHTLPLGVGLDEASPACCIHVDYELRPKHGFDKPNPATRFHAWIYRSMPNVNAIVHTHAPYISAFSTLGRPLPVTHMDDCLLFEDCSYLAQWPGVPVHDSEGQIITAALGKSSSVVLAGHGYVATGESVEIATYRAVAIEQCAQRALLALAVGNQQNLDPAAARQAREFLHQPEIVSLTFSYWARRSGVANWTTQGAQQ